MTVVDPDDQLVLEPEQAARKRRAELVAEQILIVEDEVSTAEQNPATVAV